MATMLSRSQVWEAFVKLIKAPAASDVRNLLLQEIQFILKDGVVEDLYITSQKPLHDLVLHCAEELHKTQNDEPPNLSTVQLRDAIQKFAMTKLYNRLYRWSEDDKNRDFAAARQLTIHRDWVGYHNLDVNEEVLQDTRLGLAAKQLSDMHTFKDPMDKLICILNCCQIISGVLSPKVSVASKDETSDHTVETFTDSTSIRAPGFEMEGGGESAEEVSESGAMIPDEELNNTEPIHPDCSSNSLSSEGTEDYSEAEVDLEGAKVPGTLPGDIEQHDARVSEPDHPTALKPGGEPVAVAADDFLPTLIWVVLQASPLNIVSSIQYIGKFCHPDQLHGAASYFFTHFYSAVAFIENMDHEALSMTRIDYEKMIAIAEPKPSPTHSPLPSPTILEPPSDEVAPDVNVEDEQLIVEHNLPEIITPAEPDPVQIAVSELLAELPTEFPCKGLTFSELTVSELQTIFSQYQDIANTLLDLRERHNIIPSDKPKKRFILF